MGCNDKILVIRRRFVLVNYCLLRNKGDFVVRTEIEHLGIGALVFDGFGTLFDLESAAPAFDLVFHGRGLEVSRWWRARQLAYTRRCILTRRYQNLWVLMEQALDDASRHFQVAISSQIRNDLCSEYFRLAMFPEVPEVLNALHNRYKLILLSHGTQFMLEKVVSHNKLDSLLDSVLSVDIIQSYKPELKVYELATQNVNLPSNAFSYVGGNPMDLAGAKAYGMKTIWLHRNAPAIRLMGLIADISITSLKDLSA